jgi:hypothetical protein
MLSAGSPAEKDNVSNCRHWILFITERLSTSGLPQLAGSLGTALGRPAVSG